MEENQKPASVQKMKWSAILTTDDYTTARAKADTVKGKVKLRPNGKFEVRVGTPVKPADKTAEQSQE